MKHIKIFLSFLILGIGISLFYNHPAQSQGLFIRGDVNCDGSVTPADTTYLGDYLFRSGPGPACRATADVNDNGIINLDDYTYLVNYFSGGPAPFLPFPICGTDLSGTPCTVSCCTNTECNDGTDNDGDGLIDFPADCGCTDVFDTSEAPNDTTECNDGIDNDGDGFTDYPEDCGCFTSCDSTEAPNPVRQCNDGIDNDGDGLIDLADTNCVNACDNLECSPFPCSTCCFRPGDVNGDGKITLTDIVGLVNIVFKGAQEPCPRCRGDVDGFGTLNLIDIIRLVGYVFKGGPSPIRSGVCCL